MDSLEIKPARGTKHDADEKAPFVTKRTTKQGLVQSMVYFHPTSSLEVDALSANTTVQNPACSTMGQEAASSTTAKEPLIMSPESPRLGFFNLAVKSKAVYQPVFHFRRWLEEDKKVISEVEEHSISDIETRLPVFKGPGASVVDYVKEVEKVEERLLAFYNGSDSTFKNHQ
ncbi:hypothetical protein BGZ47_005816 [Haplosporangium gracile]|nr:hypothetical protein BGZ47_005816 [Haplosporangium gracile]